MFKESVYFVHISYIDIRRDWGTWDRWFYQARRQRVKENLCSWPWNETVPPSRPWPMNFTTESLRVQTHSSSGEVSPFTGCLLLPERNWNLTSPFPDSGQQALYTFGAWDLKTSPFSTLRESSAIYSKRQTGWRSWWLGARLLRMRNETSAGIFQTPPLRLRCWRWNPGCMWDQCSIPSGLRFVRQGLAMQLGCLEVQWGWLPSPHPFTFSIFSQNLHLKCRDF